MKMHRHVLIAAASLSLFVGCSTTEVSAPDTVMSWPASATASAERFKRDLTTLAADTYEGRESGTPGYAKAVDYVRAAYEEIGLRPAGENGSYMQNVPLRREKAVPEASELLVNGEPLTLYKDFVVSASTYSSAFSEVGEVVFMGYGLDAPMFGQTAYDEIDVTGKIVAVLSGTPEDLPSEERAHFGQSSTKRAAAKAHGAAGFVIINPKGGFSEDRLKAFTQRANEVVVHPDGESREISASAYMTEAGTAKLASAAQLDISELNDSNAPMSLGVTMGIAGESDWEDFSAPNVIGMIEGTDPNLKDEYVVLTAHLDHIGKLRVIENNPSQDIINNGAMDNASGIATLLEEARKFSAGEPPRRSVLFVALAAEEMGLLGSEYFAQHPTVPADAMVANVNLDMPILLHEFTDVIAFGAQHSSLKETAQMAAASMGVTLSPDPVPNMVLFVRSDHYNFVKQGIPSVFLFLGFENGGEEKFRWFMGTNYHRPGDDISQEILWDQAARFAEINYRIAKSIANADERPSWNEGDFFGDYFATEN